MILTPGPGQFYRHYKGGVYKVRTLARCAETQALRVVYDSLTHPGKLPWDRTLEDWGRPVEPGAGGQNDRFWRLDDPDKVLYWLKESFK